MLNLTTLLAHSSGEWIASYWPICSVAEVANPHRMGAALTYARRYALFTLVGIAGEDDLDAPDICMPAPATGSSSAGLQFPSQPQGNGKVRGAVKTPSPVVLPVDKSAALRDRLLSEIAGLASQDSATSWARETLPTKNSLTAADASCWRMRSTRSSPASCSPNPPRQWPAAMISRAQIAALRRLARAKAPIRISPPGSTKACSR